MTPSQIIHCIHGARPNADCADLSPFTCWVCGGSARRGMLRTKWMGTNYTAQNRARCPDSEHVCEACVTVMAGRPPDTERMWSHLVEGDEHRRANKGGKSAIREFLRREHHARWFAAIADTGQKHIIPWCPVNAPRQTGGRVLFEETLVELPRTNDGWGLLDDLADALTDGLTKEEISRGEYSARAWQLIGGDRLRELEGRWSTLRGGGWFDLAVWLAQRDEPKVQARLDAEKAARAAKKKEATKDGSRRTGKGKAPNADGGGAARAPSRIPADAGVQRAQALGPAERPPARSRKKQRDAGGVAHVDDAHASDRVAAGHQLSLLPGPR